MDRYRINFVCTKTPDQYTGLSGFRVGENYPGRAFNGLIELNAEWGSDADSKLISQSLFNEYFELVEEEQLVKT